MARVETTFGADSSAVRNPNHAPSGRDPAASPQSPVGPSDEIKNGPRTEVLQTAAGGTETSSGSNVSRSSRAVDHDREHAGNRHNSVSSQQASPSLTTGIGFNIAELAAKALETAGVPESQDLPEPETAGHTATHFAVVIPKPEDESQVQAGRGSNGTKPAEQSERQTRGMNATASESLKRRKRSATSRTVPPTIEDTAGETLSTGKSTGMAKLPRVAVSNTPQSGSGVDGLPRSELKPQTTSLDNTGETIETGKRKVTAGHTAIKRPRKAFGTEIVLLTTKDTADETTSIGTPAEATSPFRTTENETLRAFTNKDWKTQDSLQRPVCHDGSATEENSACEDLEARYAARAERRLRRTRLNKQKKVTFEPSNQDAPHGSQIFVEGAPYRPTVATREVELPTPTNGESAATTKPRLLLSYANIRIMTPDGDGSLKIEVDGHWAIKFVDKPVPFPSNGSPSTIWVSPMRPLHP
ncbi:uncharacterized protein BBA_09609 [Beauveria bassiana ARSEF 2860]|uniref:Uncharacterized protein n=1 Tax=Beauveria bassiana (strain ARSEF 2860) TaxID=655819 RepID=J4KL16_BEAB2|nr:uncharacterized protein BBA_09609 [Beauveria bassiana ARSEF 2860]EJP61419.1 hypothetical protein BBA_09609 [Beauveria bassiana ARSEF 2860]